MKSSRKYLVWVWGNYCTICLEEAQNEEDFQRLGAAAQPSSLGAIKWLLHDNINGKIFHELEWKWWLAPPHAQTKSKEQLRSGMLWTQSLAIIFRSISLYNCFTRAHLHRPDCLTDQMWLLGEEKHRTPHWDTPQSGVCGGAAQRHHEDHRFGSRTGPGFKSWLCNFLGR